MCCMGESHGNVVLRHNETAHLLIVLSEGSAHGIFVDCLYNTYDFPITVTDGHTEDGLSLVACQLVYLITEAVVLQ